MTKLKNTCRSATCFLIATLFDHIAHNIIVTVDHKYEAKAIENADSGNNIHVDTIANEITNIKLPDCTNAVRTNQIQKNIHGLILAYSEKSIISVINPNQSFIKENAKNITPKLNKNLLIATTLLQRDKKVIHIAPINTNGNAMIETLRLNHTTHNTELVSIVQIFDQRITANADVSERTHVQTKASTNTEITLELCNIAVINIQLQKDFNTEDVNLFSKFLNHQLVKEETACSR